MAAENFLFALVEDITSEEKEKIKLQSLEEKIKQIKEILQCQNDK